MVATIQVIKDHIPGLKMKLKHYFMIFWNLQKMSQKKIVKSKGHIF